MPSNDYVTVIGGGLAGSEAAYQLAEKGVPTVLYEMKPEVYSLAHELPYLAELVCSNSLRGDRPDQGVGLLKAEMRLAGSLILACAEKTKVPAGGALAVDRELFAAAVTERIEAHPLIRIERERVTSLAPFRDQPVIVATGPLTDSSLFDEIQTLLGLDNLHFFDAAAPIVEADSIDRSIVFAQSRYHKGGDDYLNCPMTKAEYLAFREALLTAERADVHDFEDDKLFSGCMPIESLADRGEDTMRFGPLKPVGLTDPRTGEEPYAVVQLRQDNAAASLYNLVGFQTRLKFPEQRRVFGMIPGLAAAEFARYGVMHRNTFLRSPGILDRFYRLIKQPRIMFAGQITGVEGYIESAASGLLAGRVMAATVRGEDPASAEPELTREETMIASLGRYIATADPKDFQPMKATFGLLPEMNSGERGRLRKAYGINLRGRKARRLMYTARALEQAGMEEERIAEIISAAM